METVKDYVHYTNLMRNGFYDKLFWIDKLFDKWESLLDYGCADGFQTKLIGKIFRDKHIVGYDDSKRMVDMAMFSGEKLENVSFTNNFEPADVVFLSSVIHEIYNYMTPVEIEGFWKQVFEGAGKYIIIRDMIYDADSLFDLSVRRKQVLSSLEKYCDDKQHTGELQRFISVYGPMNAPHNLMHFLLKYSYIDSPNWKREIYENYIKLSLQEFKKLVPKSWEIIYLDNNCLPFFKHKWKEDLGLNLDIKTHSKIILKRKDENI